MNINTILFNYTMSCQINYPITMKPFIQPEILRHKVEHLKDKHKDYVTALPYIPLAISNLFATMPLTELKYVRVMFYKTGILTIAKRSKRRQCGVLTRESGEILRIPLSEDDEPILSYDPDNFMNFSEQPLSVQVVYARTNLRIKRPLKTRARCINAISPYHANTLKSLYGVKEYTNRRKTRSRMYKEVLHSPFFYETEIDWLEAALQLLRQGHVILSSILFAKDLTFLYVDNNFNLKKSRDITTKERKKGRIGLTFHLTRELLKFLKCVVDAHTAFRSGLAHQNAFINTVYDVLTNNGMYTAAYRHKYRIMRHIKKCKCIRREDEQNGTLSIDSTLRVWLSFFRGHIPLLYRYASNLVSRMLNKREVHPKTITAQRIESAQEIHTRDALLAETNNKNVLAHFTEAWRSHKACLSYSTNNAELDGIINLYIAEKMRQYERNTVINRRRMYKGNIDKAQQRKNIGRITRLYLRKEILKQNEIMNMRMNVDESVRFYELMKEVLKSKYVPFPLSVMNEDEEFHLEIENGGVMAVPRNERDVAVPCNEGNVVMLRNGSKNGLKQRNSTQEGPNGTDSSTQKHKTTNEHQRHRLFDDYKPLERKIYEEMLSAMNVENALPLPEIKNRILTQRVFKEVRFNLRDNISSATPTYEISEDERQIDSFVDLWISYFFNRNEDLFVRDLFRLKAFSFFCTFRIKMQPIDLNLLQHVLSIFIDSNIVQYVIARVNCTVVYKDVNFVNRVGVPKGFEFSFLIYEAYYAAVDFLFKEQDVFYVRRDDRVIIARNDAIFDEQYVEEVLTRRGCLTSIFEAVDHVFTEHEFSFHNVHVGKTAELESVCPFVHRIRNINAFQSFLSIAEKWNMHLLSLVVTYREFLTDEHVKTILRWENRILNLIKNHINSKMPTRFPNVIFYAPVELGGLGMFSIGNGVPSLVDYVRPWREVLDEHGEFISRKGRREASAGCTRNNGQYIAESETLIRNARIRGRYKRYNTGDNPFAHFNSILDGKLWSTKRYKYDMTEFFGGPEYIISQSVLASISTAYDPQTLWRTTTYGTMTKAQLSGARLFPNRRFVFYWSPLINTSDVYVGYATVMDKSGIVMHGKLASLKMSYLKVFRDNLWMKICEEYVVELVRMNGCRKVVVDGKKWCGGMGVDAVFENVTVYDEEGMIGKDDGNDDDIEDDNGKDDRKDCGKHGSNENRDDENCNGKDCGKDDDNLHNENDEQKINVVYYNESARPSHKKEQVRINTLSKRRASTVIKMDTLWCDVQFTWGDYKTNDIRIYTQRRYLELKNDPLSFYPCEKGFVVGVDLLYNRVSAFGYLPVNLQLPCLTRLREYGILKSRILKTLGLEVNEKVVGVKELSNSIIKYEEYVFNARTGILLVNDTRNGNDGVWIGNGTYGQHTKGSEEKETRWNNHVRENAQTCVVMDNTEGIKSKCKIFFPALRALLTEQTKAQLINDNNTINIYKHWKYSSYTNFCRFVLILNAYRISKNLVIGIKDVFAYKDDRELIVMEHFLKDVIINKYREERGIKRTLSNTEVKEVVFGMDVEVYKDLRIRTRDRIGDEIEKRVKSVNKEMRVDEKWKKLFKQRGELTGEGVTSNDRFENVEGNGESTGEGVMSNDRIEKVENRGELTVEGNTNINHDVENGGKEQNQRSINNTSLTYGTANHNEHEIKSKTFVQYEMILVNRTRASSTDDNKSNGRVIPGIKRFLPINLMNKCTVPYDEHVYKNTYQNILFSCRNGHSLFIPQCLINKLLEIHSPQIPLLALVLKGSFDQIHRSNRYITQTAHKNDYFLAIPPQCYNGVFIVLPSDPVIDMNDVTGIVIINGDDEQIKHVHNHFNVQFNVCTVSPLNTYGYFLVPDKNYNSYFKPFDKDMKYEYVLGVPSYFYDVENRFNVNYKD